MARWYPLEPADADFLSSPPDVLRYENYESSLPLFKRFAEDYIVGPGGEATRFTWVLAIEPKKVMTLSVKVLAPLLKAGFERIPHDGQKYVTKHA